MSGVRIGINALFLIPGGVGGTEIYLRGVLDSIAAVDNTNEYFVFRNRESGSDLTPAQKNFHDLPQPVNAVFRPGRIAYEQTILPFVVRAHRVEVLLNAGFTAPLLCACPMVTVFHDLQYKHHPEYFRWFDLPFWQVLLPASAGRSRRLVTLSESVKEDLVKLYGESPARIGVIPHGVEPAFERIAQRRATEPPRRKLILSVSTLHPHKNLNALLIAFRSLLEIDPDWTLRIIGLKGFEAQSIERFRRELGLGRAVEIPGWLSREEVYRSYAEAHALIYPSKFEGFGIPVLEALTCGLPVACSQLPSLVEIAGESARYFDPSQINQLERALLDITLDESLREHLRDTGLVRAKSFSREASARKLVALLTSVSQPSTRSKNSQDCRAASSQR